MTQFDSIFQHTYTVTAFPLLFRQNIASASINAFRGLSSGLHVVCQLGYK